MNSREKSEHIRSLDGVIKRSQNPSFPGNYPIGYNCGYQIKNLSNVGLDWVEGCLFSAMDYNYYKYNYGCFLVLLEFVEHFGSNVLSEDFLESKFFSKLDTWFDSKISESSVRRATIHDYLLMFCDFSEGFLDRNVRRFADMGACSIVTLFSEQNFSEKLFLDNIEGYLTVIKSAGMDYLDEYIRFNRRLSEDKKAKFINFLKVRSA